MVQFRAGSQDGGASECTRVLQLPCVGSCGAQKQCRMLLATTFQARSAASVVHLNTDRGAQTWQGRAGAGVTLLRSSTLHLAHHVHTSNKNSMHFCAQCDSVQQVTAPLASSHLFTFKLSFLISREMCKASQPLFESIVQSACIVISSVTLVVAT